MPAISRPPTAARTPTGSPGLGRCKARARLMTATLWRQTASSMPVPRPVTARHGLAGEDHRQGRGGGGVADAHVPGGQGVHPGGGGGFGPLHPHQQGPQGLFPGHGRLLGHIAGTVSHLPGDELRNVAEIVVDPDVHHLHPGPGVAGQGVDAGAAPEEVMDHLKGDLLGIGAHPFGHHPVVRGKDHHPSSSPGGQQLPADAHVAGRQLFQPAQTARAAW